MKPSLVSFFVPVYLCGWRRLEKYVFSSIYDDVDVIRIRKEMNLGAAGVFLTTMILA